MAERPIIFSAPMVRAILDGRKTQTRRLLAIRGHRKFSEFGPSDTPGYDWHFRDAEKRWHDLRGSEVAARLRYAVGDRLWVRESFMPAPDEAVPTPPRPTRWNIAYAAGGQEFRTAPADYNPMLYNYERWSPPIHMPRWASRITLKVTGVKVERLQAISEADAIAEGVIWQEPTAEDHEWARARAEEGEGDGTIDGVWIAPGTRQGWGQTTEERNRPQWGPTAAFAYRCLWNSINGPGSWDANPWVVAISFERIPTEAPTG